MIVLLNFLRQGLKNCEIQGDNYSNFSGFYETINHRPETTNLSSRLWKSLTIGFHQQ